MNETKRSTAFRLAIAKQIPKFPNNKASLQALETKPLGSLLIDYANWAIRYIAPRSRTVVVEQSASSDPRWQSLGAHIQALLKKAEDGDDLTPHLSLKPHKRGFTPAASAPGPNVDRWADKDMLLNVMGYHHLHLDAAPSNQIRSDDVLFAHVTRDLFTVVGNFQPYRLRGDTTKRGDDCRAGPSLADFRRAFDPRNSSGADRNSHPDCTFRSLVNAAP
jgi:hypothetical protein